MRPSISVLIPTYNRPGLLLEAVESVLAQTFRDFELIVVNDGGEDVSDRLDRLNDSRLVYLHLPQNGGKARALNRALDVARAPCIAYLDDDDHYYPHHLETLFPVLEAHPEAGLVYSDFEEVNYEKDEQGRRRETDRRVKYSVDFNRAALLKENYIPHPTILHRRELLERQGGFAEDFPCLIDWELFHRLAFYTDFLHVPQVTGEYFINREKGDHITN
ncbi:MAG: glycosyltransferase, partial [Candidatus Zixiibacteriota bacterium]